MFRTRKKSILYYSGAVGLLKRKDKNEKKKRFGRGSRWRLLPMSALRATLIELQPFRRFHVNPSLKLPTNPLNTQTDTSEAMAHCDQLQPELPGHGSCLVVLVKM
jgi:hypothetical protein